MSSWPEEPDGALAYLRRIWLGVMIYHGIIMVLGGWVGRTGWLNWVLVGQGLGIFAAAVLVLGFPLAGYVRMQFYKRHWQDQAVTPKGYLKGNIAMLTASDVAISVAVVAAGVSGQLLWLIPAVIAWGIEGMNWPSGEPMQPQGPRL